MFYGLGGFAFEVVGKGVSSLGADCEQVAYGFDLLGDGFGPGLFACCRCLGGLGFLLLFQGGAGLGGGLVFGAQPADVALGFFGIFECCLSP